MKDSGAHRKNSLAHMIVVSADAGMARIEPIFSWMGDLADPVKLSE